MKYLLKDAMLELVFKSSVPESELDQTGTKKDWKKLNLQLRFFTNLIDFDFDFQNIVIFKN